jgi:hypothetical protein
LKSKGGVMVSVVTTGEKRDSTVSMSDQLSIPSISIASDYKADFGIAELSPSNFEASSSLVDNLDIESQGPSHQLEGTILTDPPTSHVLDTAELTPHPYAADVADTV